jgi:hypothetical protein
MSNRFLTNKSRSNITNNNLDIDNLVMFPELKEIKHQTNELTNNSIDFKNILNLKTEEINNEKQDIILPGWAKLTRKHNNLAFEYKGKIQLRGIETAQVKKKRLIQEQKVNVEAEAEENLNEVMDNIILEMEDKWYRYEYIYDQIHGEGAYADKFILPPVYGVEYESDTETEEENSDYIASDDENIYNEYDKFD